MRKGKQYSQALTKVDRTQRYSLEEAIALAKENKYTKFDETLEINFRLGVDPRHADQMLRGSIVLPNGTGKEVKLLVLTKGEKIKEAEEAGADFVGNDEYIEKIKDGWLDFDMIIASPDMMGAIGKLGRVLGPRGLMPTPKTGTVTFEIEKAVKESKSGKVTYKIDKQGNMHIPAGKTSFTKEALVDNVRAIIYEILRVRPAAFKGQYIKNIVISTTMGPGIKVDLDEAVRT